MRKVIWLLAFLLCIKDGVGQTLFYESFDNVPGSTAGGEGTYVFPNGWILANVDNRTPAPGITFVKHAWERNREYKFNPSDTAAYSTSYYIPAGQADDWMWTPPITLTGDSLRLSWRAMAYDDNFPDGYEVRIMLAPDVPTGTTGSLGNMVSNSTLLLSVVGEQANAWKYRTLNLDAYAGQTVRIAFRNHSNDQFLLLVDDVKIENLLSAGAARTLSVCVGNDLHLSATPVGGIPPFSYTWTGPNSFASSDQNPTVSNVTSADAGDYTVVITDSRTPVASTSSSITTVTVNAPTTSVTNLSICTDALPYSWNGLVFTGAGSQTAHLTNAGGCDSAATLNLSVAQGTLFYESFDNVPGSTAGGEGTYVFPSGWILANVDNRTPAPGITFVKHAWERNREYKFNPTDTAAYSTSYYNPAGQADDWMWTPPITLCGDSLRLSWRAMTYDASFPDGYEVRIMVAPDVPTGTTGSLGNMVSNSTVLLSVAAEQADIWKYRTLNLDAYVGQTVRIAFRNHSNDQFLLLVDDVKVENALSARASNDGPVCTGNDLHLSVTPNGGEAPYTYSWTGPDAFASTDQNPTISNVTAANAGLYTVVVTDSRSPVPATVSVNTNVTVNALPATPTIAAGGATTFCKGGSVVLTSSSATGNQWYLNGSPIGGATNTTYEAFAPGRYTVLATENGCSSDSSGGTVVTVNANPRAEITAAGPISFCQGDSVLLTATGGINRSYQWLKGASIKASDTNRIFYAKSSGNFRVTITNTLTGCSSTSPRTLVTVYSSPAITPILGVQPLCKGNSLQLNNTTTSGKWQSSDINKVIVSNSGLITGLATGSVKITYSTAPNSNGCVNKTSSWVSVKGLPSISSNISGNKTVCAGSNTQLTNTTTGGTWSSSDNNIATVSSTGLVTGLAQGSVIITYTTAPNTLGCENKTSATVNVIAPCTIAPAYAKSRAYLQEVKSPSLEVNIFPNPSGSLFNVQVKAPRQESINIRVLDVNGKTAFIVKGMPDQVFHFGEQLQAGVYLVEVRLGEEVKTVKAVKLR